VKMFKKPKSKFYWYDFMARGHRYRGSTQETKSVRARGRRRTLAGKSRAGGDVAFFAHSPAATVLLTVREKEAVAKPKRDRLREERIHNEVIVDAYGPEEQALGWYYFLEGKLRFPFPARCILARVVSPLRKGETVKVRSMAPEDACTGDMLVLIR
jgi:Calcium binding